LHVAGAAPGKEVNLQQVTKPLRNMNDTMPSSSPTPIQAY
jgi:hypothetical protein